MQLQMRNKNHSTVDFPSLIADSEDERSGIMELPRHLEGSTVTLLIECFSNVVDITSIIFEFCNSGLPVFLAL